ncbi:putative polypeptide N-acetylgalactosaminyltransferase 9, partial [Stegodyphus dumicola]|uniref:putative polypeptide N-acetylgalactosaminyltransferase 9 n=1 Tax=Stegodyphus dumicola TaxID=202533 RepID=UPI0015AB9071
MILFHRRKSLLIKVLLIVPATWLVVTMLMTYSEKLRLEKEDNTDVVNHVDLNNNGANVEKYEGRKPRQSLEDNKVQEPNQDPQLGFLAPPQDPDGPGELGKPVKLTNLTEEQKLLVKQGWEKNAFNQYVSDLISLHRSLPDVRGRG